MIGIAIHIGNYKCTDISNWEYIDMSNYQAPGVCLATQQVTRRILQSVSDNVGLNRNRELFNLSSLIKSFLNDELKQINTN